MGTELFVFLNLNYDFFFSFKLDIYILIKLIDIKYKNDTTRLNFISNITLDHVVDV